MDDNNDGGVQWRDSEVLDFISIWGDTSIQAKLVGSYRNRSVYERISKQMAERGYRRTWLQCQRKAKSLKAKYKEARDSNKRSGRGRIICPFYNELDLIFGDKPSTQPVVLLDSAVEGEEDKSETPRSTASPASSHDDGETGDSIPESLPPTTPESLRPARTPESLQSTSSPAEESSSSAPSTDNTTLNKSCGTASARSRKRKSKMEATLEVFAEKISNALHQDDTDFHLKMQKAQHEHEMKMFSMFTQFMERSNQPLQPPFFQAPGQPPSLCNFRPPPPQPSYHNFTQPHPFGETSNQPLSFLHDLAQAPPFNYGPAHSPDLAQPFNQAPVHPRDLVQRAPFSQASAHSAPFYQPPDEEEN